MKYLALMSAIALTSAVGFTACSSSDEVSENKPVIDAKDFGKGVVTQFALNIGSASGTTRSTPNVAQQNDYFRGIQDIHLIPMDFAQTTTNTGINFTNYVNNSNANDIQNTSATGYSKYETIIYHLGDIANTSSMEALGNDVYKRIYSLTLPVGTTNFLFYGRAKEENTQTGTNGFDNDANALNGKLSIALAENTANAGGITFTLNAIESTVNSGDGSPRYFLLNILNTVAQTKIGTAEPFTYWSKLDNTLHKNKTLLQAYSNLTTVGTTELRAGSAEAIRATLQELYRTVLAQERYGEDDEVQDMAAAIRANLDTYFDVYFAAEGSTTPFVAANKVAAADINKQTSGGIYDYDNDYYKPYLKYKETDKNKINFPVPQGLPSGVVNLTFTPATAAPYGSFSYKNNSTVAVTGGNATTNFTFPAELTYFANSALRASDISKEADDYPVNGKDWDDPDNGKWDYETTSGTPDWSGTVVTADTRSVAMKNRVFYGVSQLQSTVQLGFNSGTSLDDNRAAILNDGKTADQSIEIGNNSFILTGILIGQQPDAAGWNFLSTNNSFNKVVYDRILPISATAHDTYYTYPTFPEAAYSQATTGCNFVTTTPTVSNYTLLLDNYNSSGTQDDVSVALEFINNTGKDFYGRDNVIPAGGTFYLVGKLTKPAAGTISWATDYNVSKNGDYTTRIPAYGTDRVFVQDHTTVANFKIGTDALKKAYNTIPDLRTVQMLFGLSVDLNWRSGISYTGDNSIPLNQ